MKPEEIKSDKAYSRIFRRDWKYTVEAVGTSINLAMIKFQTDRTRAVGINGVHSSDLLIIVQDRIRCLQAGAFSCDEHERILQLLSEARQLLKQRPK